MEIPNTYLLAKFSNSFCVVFCSLRAPIPCCNCIFVSFCSEKCQEHAWKTHHQYECEILGLLSHSGISVICYMALRILTQVWYLYFLVSKIEIFKKLLHCAPIVTNHFYKFDLYNFVCFVVTHFRCMLASYLVSVV